MSVVLMYHRVADLHPDPYGLAVGPRAFAAHVQHLRRMGCAVPLAEVVQPRTARTVAITFDDGYADNATVAAPILTDAGLPATWFITSGRLGGHRFWWDRLVAAFLGDRAFPPSLLVEVAGQELWFDLRTPAARTTALWFLRGRLLPLGAQEIEATVDRVSGLLGAPGPPGGGSTMTVEELRHLAALPLQEIGAHTRTHAQLRGKAVDVQRDEIAGSVRDLTELIAAPVTNFAYPFGHPRDDVGPLAPRLVAEAGCRLACTTQPGPVRRRSDQHLLPRLTVGNWGVEEFSTRLQALLDGR